MLVDKVKIEVNKLIFYFNFVFIIFEIIDIFVDKRLSALKIITRIDIYFL